MTFWYKEEKNFGEHQDVLFCYASEEKAMLANTAGALLTDLFIVILAVVFTYITNFI